MMRTYIIRYIHMCAYNDNIYNKVYAYRKNKHVCQDKAAT